MRWLISLNDWNSTLSNTKWATSRERVSSGIFDQVRFKPACSATETSWNLETLDRASIHIILSKQRTTKVLIRLRGCADWSALLLFAYGINRFSTVGFLLLQCSSGVVRHPRDLQVSVATRFCRILNFASSYYLSVIYLFHVMIHWWVRKPSRGPNNYMFWAMIEAEGEVGYS